MLRGFSLRDFGASLNTVESHTNESSQGKIGLYETVNKQKCTHLGMFLASVLSLVIKKGEKFTVCVFNNNEEQFFHDFVEIQKIMGVNK